MSHPPRKVAYILASTDHGSMIVNRFDYHLQDEAQRIGSGVGFQLLGRSSFDPAEVDLLIAVLRQRRQHHGDGVVAVDGGANIGVHTIEWARAMTGWGQVVAFEAQERIFYALAGNVALNNCFNASVNLAALSDGNGMMSIPQPDYFQPGSFGSLELRPAAKPEFIGQAIDRSEMAMTEVKSTTIDSLGFIRLDLLKLDVEGMEVAALRGAQRTLTRHRPILLIENLKADTDAMLGMIQPLGYRVFEVPSSLLAIHAADPCLSHFAAMGLQPIAG